MNEPIKPALTPEEWATIEQGHRERREEDGPDPLYHPTRHGIAAANLRGQPFGFTWEDVDDEIAAAVEAEAAARYAQVMLDQPPRAYENPGAAYASYQRQRADAEAKAQRFRSRAAKIAALLPPRWKPMGMEP